MNSPLSRGYSLTLALSLCTLHLTAAVPDKPLRYGFGVDQTNCYRIEIQTQGEAGPEAAIGTFLIWSKPAGSNFVALSMKGQFHAKPLPGRPPMMFRPGHVPLISILGYGAYSGPHQTREVTIDDRGRIVRIGGDLSLPIPLGTLFTALFPELPTETSEKWETSETVFVMDDPILQGPAHVFSLNPYGGSFPGYIYSPGRPTPGPLAAKMTTKHAIQELSNETVSVLNTLTLDSLLNMGEEPRISSSAEARYIFDRETGLPKSTEWNAKSLVVTEHSSRRTTLTFSAQKLEGEELAKALQPPPPPKPAEEQKLSSKDAAALIAKMQSSDMGERMNAANELSAKTVEKLEDSVQDKLATLVNSSDDSIRRAVWKTLAAHPRQVDLPVLSRGVLENQDSNLRQSLIRAIGGLKSPKAATALAEFIASGSIDSYGGSSQPSESAEALIRMGTMAEPAVLPLLKQPNMRALIDACTVLREVGSSRGMTPLKELVAHPVKSVSEAAAGAIRAIQSREESGRARR